MSKGRMISSEIWEDDYFIELSLLERMIWIGLLTCSADDQGRMQDNARLIHSQLFPVDDLDDALIEKALEKFASAGKIVRYKSEGKKLIQITNWWRYQSPRWCGKSKYKPPEGWIDRERYHGTGNTIFESNWSDPGGFKEHSTAHSTAHSTEHSIEHSNVNHTINDGDGDVNGDGDGDGEGDGDWQNSAPSPAPYPAPKDYQFSTGWQVRVFSDVTGIPGIPGTDMPRVMEALDYLRGKYGTELELEQYLIPYFQNWINRKTKDGRRYSRSNCAWLYDLAVAGEPLPGDDKPEPVSRPDPNCPKCGGIGFIGSGAKYGEADFGKLVQCSCVKVREVVDAGSV